MRSLLIQICVFSVFCGTFFGTFLGVAWPAIAANSVTWQTLPATSGEYRQAIALPDWHFPDDFGPHNDYQTEWWYYTGNLETEDERPFGFQLTFFRQAISPTTATESTSSAWRTNQIYSAHFTVSDIAGGGFYVDERFSRNAVGLAGAEAMPYRVWLNDWSATELEPGRVRLQAQSDEVAIDLTVQQTRPPVLQGDRGLSIKGMEPGNASYYYSLVQQPTTGTVTIQGKSFPVHGKTWKDHEYSTSALTAGTVGWDWFSIQLEDGSALMLYQLRHEDGTPEVTSAGTFVSASGETTHLNHNDWTIRVLKTWKSPRSKAIYPAQWQIRIPKLDLVLEGRSLLADQELNTSTATYWEGATAFEGTRQDQPIQGTGYVELTGYATRLDSLLSESTP
ncbi:MAG: lipocalin-like domain-containing protein [Cyanobacteriota bacterium]